MIGYKCSECGCKLESPDTMADQTHPCPECGATVRVPRPEAPGAEKRKPPAPRAQPPDLAKPDPPSVKQRTGGYGPTTASDTLTARDIQGERGSCPVCGERVVVDGQFADGRAIGTCGDAFTAARWRHTEGHEPVAPGFECPHCGQDDPDELLCDGLEARCQRCGAPYPIIADLPSVATIPSCLRCGGNWVVSGDLTSSQDFPWFMPHDITTTAKLLSVFTSWPTRVSLLNDSAYVCLDCGLQWAEADLRTAEDWIDKWGSDDLKARLRSSDELDQMPDEIDRE